MASFLDRMSATAPRREEKVATVIETEKSPSVPSVPYVDTGDSIHYLPMGEVYADEEFNCRGKIAPIDVVELAKNINQNGLIQPIIVQPWTEKKGYKYRVVAGYRRYMAHVVNKAEVVKSIIRDNLSEDDARFLNLSENLNRENLNIMQEAKVVKGLLNRGHTQDEIKDRLDISRLWVQVRIYALNLPPEIQQEVEAGWIKQNDILGLNTLRKDPVKQIEAAKVIKERRQSGEKSGVKVNKKTLEKNPNVKMARDRKQIQNMLDHILDSAGASFATRCLAWASGEISSQELYDDIKKECDDQGRSYFPPKHDIASDF